MISVANNNGPRGLYLSASFYPLDTPPADIAAAYTDVSTSVSGDVYDRGWFGPNGGDGPIREWLRYSLMRQDAGVDDSGDGVGDGQLAIFSAGDALTHSDYDDWPSGFPGQRYFTLPGWGRCIRLILEIYTPINMFDRRSSSKNSLVSRQFSEGWPVREMGLVYGQQDFSSTGTPWFVSTTGDTYFSLDELAVEQGTAAPYPTHGFEFIPGEITL